MPNLFSVSLYSSPLSTLQPYYHILSSYPEKNNSKSLRVALICLRYQQFVLQGDTLLLNGKKKKNEDTDALTENKLLELFFFPPRVCSYITTITLWKQHKLKGMRLCDR